MASHKRYLGDGAYVDFDGYHIVLTTEDGFSITNRICLEPAVFNALTDYHTWLQECYSRPEGPE